jgi:nitrate reductase NapD
MMREIHIASCVVHARPESLDATAAQIRAVNLAEVAASDPVGRLVILLERSSAGEVLDAIDAIRGLPGVIAVNLVYQHAEDEHVMQESMS